MKNFELTKLSLLSFALLLSLTCLSRDTLEIPRHKAGVMMAYEYAGGSFEGEFKYGLGLGAFYENRLSKRFVLTTEIGFRLLNFNIDHPSLIRRQLGDLSHSRAYYKSYWNINTFSSTASLKFYFLKNPKLFVELGIGRDYRLTSLPEIKYYRTFIYDNGERVGEQYVNADRVISRIRVEKWFFKRKHFQREISIGAEMKKVNVALTYKKSFIDSFGIRIRYFMLEK